MMPCCQPSAVKSGPKMFTTANVTPDSGALSDVPSWTAKTTVPLQPPWVSLRLPSTVQCSANSHEQDAT